MSKSLYFIYGSLKKDMNNHHILEKMNAEFISPVETTIEYPMFKSGDPFPYLQDDPGFGKIVQGELWEIDDKHKDRLDQFEGVPSLYVNGKIDVECENNVYLDVNVYFKAQKIPEKYFEVMTFFDEWE